MTNKVLTPKQIRWTNAFQSKEEEQKFTELVGSMNMPITKAYEAIILAFVRFCVAENISVRQMLFMLEAGMVKLDKNNTTTVNRDIEDTWSPKAKESVKKDIETTTIIDNSKVDDFLDSILDD